jgi:pimeloyl-ACP methyl ester carboxylesterase
MADRLGDDVLTVIEKLKLDRPALAGWSLGGEEMSSIASRHPEKVSGLIYLDAAYAYGFYAPGNLVPAGSNLQIDMNDMRAKIDSTRTMQAAEAVAVFDKLQKVDLPQLQADLAAAQAALAEMGSLLQPGTPAPETLQTRINTAILAGEQKYTDLKTPILAIFAAPTRTPPNVNDDMRALIEKQAVPQEAQIKRFEAGNPTARVVRLPNAQHAVFNSNPDDVAREMNAFLEGLE